MSLVGVTQSGVEPIQIKPRKANSDCRSGFVASASSDMGFICDSQKHALHVGCTAKASFVDRVLMKWFCNEGGAMRTFVSRIANKLFSVLAFLQSVTIPGPHRAYVFHTVKDVDRLGRIVRYRPE